MSWINNVFKGGNSKSIKPYLPIVEKINKLEPDFKALSDEQLKAKTAEFKDRVREGETLQSILPEAFAAVREASQRTLGLRHFDVQLIGGMILNEGDITEMRTGEGKTLVATLPAYLNALEARGVHIVTVNDYLSRRDAVWMGQIYDTLGLSVGVLNHESSFSYDPNHHNLDQERDELGSFKVIHEFLRPVSRKEAYAADITYGTNNEYGFDYLRDNLARSIDYVVQRDYHYAVVDEIDSILIDEARTPLIISGQTTESENLYKTFSDIARTLKPEEDYEVDEKLKAITLTDAGIEKAEKALGVDNIYTEKGIKFVHHLETAVRAKALFERDKQYVVKNGEVIIVDEFTGRLQPGRRWSDGLHQAIEAKEGVSLQQESRTLASITFQNYFRMYKKLSGMTGTAMTSAEEFQKVYGLDVVEVPTNKPSQRLDQPDLIFQTEQGKMKALVRHIKEINASGQPILVGTASIEKNELLSAYLTQEGIRHEVLNAKNHEREGEIIAQAGKKGTVTIATNLAGRGVDIKLGGNPATTADYQQVKDAGGLFVVGTERHEARRIDNQLRGRSGRQGDPGQTQFFISLEDSLMRVFASDTLKKMMGRFGIPEDEPIHNGIISRALESAQTKIEGFNFDARKNILDYDDVLNQQRRSVYDRRRRILTGGADEALAVLRDIIGEDKEAEEIIVQKQKELGEHFGFVLRQILLQNIDQLWMEHLEIMDYLRSSVRLQAYGQKDPLVEYKREGLRLFKEMQATLAAGVMDILPQVQMQTSQVAERELEKLTEGAVEAGGAQSTADTNDAPRSGVRISNTSTAPMAQHHAAPAQKTVGRNDPCPCGSGKKWKKCGELNTEEHQRLMAEKK